MESKRIYNKFESLPIEAQKQVIAFIDFLQSKYGLKSKRYNRSKPLKNKKFIGIWKNREDLNNSSSWVRNLRKREWRDFAE
jgi:hypothetical protein